MTSVLAGNHRSCGNADYSSVKAGKARNPKWHRRKAAIFTKLAREIQVAV
jgi:transcriptional/translational regulatory protein YebC/TACO1